MLRRVEFLRLSWFKCRRDGPGFRRCDEEYVWSAVPRSGSGIATGSGAMETRSPQYVVSGIDAFFRSMNSRSASSTPGSIGGGS